MSTANTTMVHPSHQPGVVLMAVGVVGNVFAHVLSAIHALGAVAEDCSQIVTVACTVFGAYIVWRRDRRERTERQRAGQPGPRP